MMTGIITILAIIGLAFILLVAFLALGLALSTEPEDWRREG